MTGTGYAARTVAVVTSEGHAATLREWIGDAAECSWIVGQDNPDLEAILRSLDARGVQTAVVDDAAMVYREVSEADVLRFAEHWNRNGMGLVFVAAPDRTRDDAFLRALPAAGVTAIVPTRYFADRPEGARALLLSMIERPPSAEDIVAALDALPREQRSLLPGRRRASVPDVLEREAPEQGAASADSELPDEYDYFKSKMARRAQAETAAAAGAETAAAEAPGKSPDVDMDDLRRRLGIAGAAPRPSAETASEPNPEPQAAPAQDPAPEPEPNPEPEPAPEPKPEPAADVAAELERRRAAVSAELESQRRAVAATEPERAADRPRPDDAKPEAKPARKARECRKIAVAGLAHHAGTTHLAFSLAFAIAETAPSAAVCCLLSDKREFDALAHACRPAGGGGTVPYKGVDFAYLGAGALPEGYDFMVVDCDVIRGGAESRVSSIFSTASRRLVVCGGAPWQISEISTALADMRKHEFEDWIWCLFGASTQFKDALAQLLGHLNVKPRLLEVPYDNGYMEPNGSAPPELAEMVAPKRKKKRGGEEKAR